MTSTETMAHYRKISALNIPALKDGERAMWVLPAVEARDVDPSKDFGIHGCELRFAMCKGKRAVSVSFFTDWLLPETKIGNISRNDKIFPMCAGFYYHSDIRTNEYQSYTKDCSLSGGQCYGECGSALYGDKILERMLREGSNGVWDELEKAFSDFEEELKQ